MVTKLEGGGRGVNSAFEKLFGDLVKNNFNKLTIEVALDLSQSMNRKDDM